MNQAHSQSVTTRQLHDLACGEPELVSDDLLAAVVGGSWAIVVDHESPAVTVNMTD